MKSPEITLKINGDNIAVYEHITLDQKINEHHEFSICLDLNAVEKEGHHTIEKSKLWLGKDVVINIGEQTFKGIAMDISLDHNDGHSGSIIVSGFSSTKKMDAGVHMQSWLDKDLSAIVKDVADNYGVKAKIKPKHTANIDYECQYMEDGFGFVKRLAKQYNEWLYYNGTDLCFGKPNTSGKVVKVEYGKELTSIGIGICALPTKLKTFSFNSFSDEFHKGTTDDSVSGLNDLGQSAFKSAGQVFSKPVNYYSTTRVKSKGDIDELLKKKQSSYASKTHEITASGTNAELSLGSIIEIKSIREEMKKVDEQTYGKYIITEINHNISLGESYDYKFKAIPADLEVLPEPDVDFPLAQNQMAKVVDNNDPDKKGRVQVKMNWQTGEMKTPWLRVLTPDAGKSDKVSTNRGFVFIPEVGDQVLIGFRYNDPNRPFVLGSLFNGKTASGGQDNNKAKSITTRSGSTIIFDDDEGKGKITVSEPSGNIITMNGDGTITITAPEKIDIVSKEINLNAENKVNIKGDDEVNVKSKNATNISGDNSVSVKSTTKIEEEAPSVSIKGSTTASIDGATTNINGSAMTNIKGGIVNLN